MLESMRTDIADLVRLAGLLDYPDGVFAANALRTVDEFADPVVASHVRDFALEIAGQRPELVEEAHVRTFLVTPTTTPYVGVHLFGEEGFKRAHFMSQLVERFRALGFDPGDELPDHVAVLLRFASILEADERADLVRWCLALPLTAMSAELGKSKNPYRHVLAALATAVAPDGVAESVRVSIEKTRGTADTSGCTGCTVTHGGDEL